MNNSILPTQYPANALHAAVRDAMWEVQTNLKAPDALIAGSFLTAMSVASQGDIDVELPTGQIRPVTLNVLTIADSGERKTATDSLVCAPIYEHDAKQATAYAESLATYSVDMRYWDAIDAVIQRKIVKAVHANEDAEQYRGELIAHSKQEPRKPRRDRIIHQSITERPFMEALQGDGKSLAILSDEGEVVLRGGAMNKLGVLNKAWDGAKVLTLDRADDSVEVTNPRVTVSFMVQEQVFNDFMEKRGRIARSSGHLARYLVGYPASTQGFRMTSLQDPVWVHLPKFHERVTELLDQTATRRRAGDISRRVLQFSPEAKELWVQAQNSVESQIHPYGFLVSIRDFASKTLEITGRVAAIFHHFSGQEGAISMETLQRAIAVVEWHLEEFKRLFGDSDDTPQSQKDVRALAMHLHARYWNHGFSMAPRNEVRKCGPIRHQGQFEAALAHLCNEGSVLVPYEGRRKRFIHLNPQVFSQIQAM
jgi:hypothetical protein